MHAHSLQSVNLNRGDTRKNGFALDGIRMDHSAVTSSPPFWGERGEEGPVSGAVMVCPYVYAMFIVTRLTGGGARSHGWAFV